MAARIRVLNNLNEIRPSRLPLVIGYFGCIHVMHGQLLTKRRTFNVLTFKDIKSKQANQIYPYRQRLANINKFRPENIFIFDIAKHNMTAEQFISRVLLKIKPSEIIVGTDFTFGSDQKKYSLLRRDFKLTTVNYEKVISTTIIANLLRNNNIERANDLMYFPYYYVSKWIPGRRQGRKIGVRTINLLMNHPFFLSEGVYATKITIGYNKYNAVTFYGKSKTFGLEKPTLETHVINRLIMPRSFYPPITRDYIRIQFYKYLRPNKKFDDINDLKFALKEDIKAAKEYFEQDN